jgi:hypothetical protein
MMTRMKVRASFSVIVGLTDQNMYSDIYGIFKTTRTKNGSTTNGTQLTAKRTKTKSVIHLSLRDSLPTYGPIASMTFSLANNGVSSCSIFTTVGIPFLPTT